MELPVTHIELLAELKTRVWTMYIMILNKVLSLVIFWTQSRSGQTEGRSRKIMLGTVDFRFARNYKEGINKCPNLDRPLYLLHPSPPSLENLRHLNLSFSGGGLVIFLKSMVFQGNLYLLEV